MKGIEILRRVVLVAGVLTAALMVVWPVQVVWRVGTVDFKEIQKRKVGRFEQATKTLAKEAGLEQTPAIESPYKGELDQFTAKELEGRVLEVSGDAWRQLFDDAQATLAGKSSRLSRYLEDDYDPDFLYFPQSYSPLDSLAPRLNNEQVFTYVRLVEGGPARYLSIVLQRSHDAMSHAPNFITFPFRKQAVWVFLATLAMYLFLPRHRPGAGEFRYNQVSSAIVPDWLGLVMTTVFVVLPVLIIASNASSMRAWSLLDFEDGWGILTLVMWFMALSGLAIVVVALWYATFSLFVLPDRIRRVTLLSTNEYAYADIEMVEATTYTLPTWLKTIMIIAGMLRWRMAGTMILGATSSMSGIKLRCRDGRTVNIWFDHLNRPGSLLDIFRQRGVPMSGDVVEWMSELDISPMPVAPPSATKGVAAVVALVLMGGGALALAYWPEKTRVVRPPEREINPAVHARQEMILKEMTKVQAKMKAAFAVVEKNPIDRRSSTFKEYESLMDQFQKLQEQFEELDKIKYEPSTNTP